MKTILSLALVSSLIPALPAKAESQRETLTNEYYEAFPILADATDVDPGLALEGTASDADPNDLTPGYVIFDGDIQVRVEELEDIMNGGLRAVFGAVNYWAGTVPYDFAANVTTTNQQAAINAMNAISARAGIIFRPRVAGDTDWVRFNSSTFNNSPVGRQGGQQIINIVSWGTQIIIVHELYHSLGFWHEQSASDRDTFVTVNFGNVCGASATPGNPCNASVCQGCSDGMGGFVVRLQFQYSPWNIGLGTLRLRLVHALRSDRVQLQWR